jgi:hypothetical protein
MIPPSEAGDPIILGSVIRTTFSNLIFRDSRKNNNFGFTHITQKTVVGIPHQMEKKQVRIPHHQSPHNTHNKEVGIPQYLNLTNPHHTSHIPQYMHIGISDYINIIIHNSVGSVLPTSPTSGCTTTYIQFSESKQFYNFILNQNTNFVESDIILFRITTKFIFTNSNYNIWLLI